MEDDTNVRLEHRALWQTRELGHRIPRIDWDTTRQEGIGTCTRCGDGVLLYAGPDVPSIHGTAFESECPGESCEHGWQIIARPDGGILLRCLHCGAERSEHTTRHPEA